MKNWLHDIVLEGELIKLIPMTTQHKSALVQAASDGELWKLWYTGIPSENTIDEYMDSAMREKAQHKSLPFVVIHKKSNNVIGTTRFCHASNNNRLEIGYTWYAQSLQRTGVNTECKLLLLRYCFEELACIAVEFRTHWHNHPSRAAIARLGAKQDGVLRNDSIDSTGELRDTVVFSIIRDEWLTVKRSLLYKINQYKS
jgi:RimJ/RimL family protein N-acetyltransferase